MRFCTYNCCSLKKNIDLIRELTNNQIELIFLQETFVTSSDTFILDYIDEYYNCISIPAVYSDKSISNVAGRPMGGISCLYRNNINNLNVKLIKNTNDFMVLQVTYESISFIFVNVYIRSDLGDPASLALYLENLSIIEFLLEDIDYESIFLLGDFNADPFSGRAWDNLKDFFETHQLECFDFNNLRNSDYTYMSYSSGHTKWLDHIIGRTMNGVAVRSVEVLYDVIGSDHLPLLCEIAVPNLISDNVSSIVTTPQSSPDMYVDWASLNREELASICDNACEIQGCFEDNYSLNCHDVNCDKSDCLELIDDLYDLIVSSVESSSMVFLKEKTRKSKYKVIPGWNRIVKSSYLDFRDKYKVWCERGRPRDHFTFDQMRISRSVFKDKLKDCKCNENREIMLSIESKFQSKNMKDFWKEVKSKKGKNSVSNAIDGYTDSDEIVRLFSNKFIPDNFINDDNVIFEDEGFRNCTSENFNTAISSFRFKEYIDLLKTGGGHDNIHSIFLKLASDTFIDNCNYFLNSCFRHNHIPEKLLRGEISPIIKDKKGNKCDSNNYRPIMQSSCLLKFIEIHLVSILEEKINFKPCQFGFIKNMSTNEACLLLK